MRAIFSVRTTPSIISAAGSRWVEFPYGGSQKVPDTHRDAPDIGLAVLDEIALY